MKETMTGESGIQKMDSLKKPPLPIDSGWAWFIMIGAHVLMMIAFAFGRSLSIFLPDILERYNAPAAVTTLAFGIGDISWSITNIIIPTVLLPRFSVRTLATFGALSHCLVVIALAYAPNIIMFNCLFVVIGSSGGFMIVTSLIHLGHFFKKKLSFANSVAHTGGSIATVFMPRLAQFLKDVYGYQGAMLILAAISFHCVAAAMLLWPLSMFDDTGHTNTGKSSSNGRLELSHMGSVNTELEVKDPFDEEDEGKYLNVESKEEETNEGCKLLQINNPNKSQRNEFNSKPDLNGTLWSDVTNGQPKLENKDTLHTGELIPLSEIRFTKPTSQRMHDELQNLSSRLSDSPLDSRILNHGESNVQNMQEACNVSGDTFTNSPSFDLRQTHQDTANSEFVKECSLEEDVSNQTALINDPSYRDPEGTTSVTPDKCCRIDKIRDYMASSALLNPVAVMLIVAGGLCNPGGAMYLPVLGLENGLSPDQVPWIMTIIGVAEIFGRLAIGYFADLGYLKPIRIVCISHFILGTVCQFAKFYKGFGAMVGMAIIYGTMNGLYQALMSAIVVELLGLPYLAQIIPIFYLSSGVFTCVLNVSVGAIKDASGSFLGGFNLIGAMLLMSMVVLLLEPVFVRCRDQSRKHRQHSHREHSRKQSGSL